MEGAVLIINRKEDWVAFAWFLLGLLVTAVLLVAATRVHAQVPKKTVFVNWDVSASAVDVGGVYNVWRAPVLADGTCGAPVKIATVFGSTYRDLTPPLNMLVCYSVSFVDTGGGESLLADVPAVADTSLPSSGPITPILQIEIN